MTALAQDRATDIKADGQAIAYKVAASTKIYAGSLVATNLTGYLVPAANVAGYVVRGIAYAQADNSSGADGAITCLVHECTAELENHATYAVAQADVGHPCYVADDQTVADERAGGAVIAGIVARIDPTTSKIWVTTPAHLADVSQISGVEMVAAAGAVSVRTRTSLVAISGTMALTLADGRYEGQPKRIVVISAASTPAATLTPANYADGTSEFFSAAGEMLDLEWHSGGWRKIDSNLGLPVETVSVAGALSLHTRVSLLAIAGTEALTLADGLRIGQRKTVLVISAASTPAATLTPATYADGTSEFFSAVGEMLDLIWTGTAGWRKLDATLGLGVETVSVAGAFSLNTRISLLAITGTMAMTLADGLRIGQRKTIIVASAASTPAATVTPATYADGTSELLMAAGEILELEWTGTAGWRKVYAHIAQGAVEAAAGAGALSVNSPLSTLTVTGATAYTLADGRYVGQLKFIRCIATDNTGTVTPAHPVGYSSLGFDAVAEWAIVRWNGAAWELCACDCTVNA